MNPEANKHTNRTTTTRLEDKPILLLSFTDKAEASLIIAVEERLMEGGLKLVASETEDNVVIGLTTTQEWLEQEAEAIHMLKPRQDLQFMDHFTVGNRHLFLPKDGAPLFSMNDESLLMWRLLDDINVLQEGTITSNLSRQFDQLKVKYRPKIHRKDKVDLKEHPTFCLRYVLEKNGFCDVVSSIHAPGEKKAIWKKTRGWSMAPPAQQIQEYYGDEVAFYFAWMGFLTRWLCVPGTLGLGAYCFRWYREDDIGHDEYTPFYGLMTFIWAVLFVEFWERAEKRWSYKWGTMMGEYEKAHYFAMRPQFVGKVRQSPVTGEMEMHYPAWRRYLKYMVSAAISVLMLGAAFTAMICSLNLQGYIHPSHDPTRWKDEDDHPFFFPKLAKLAEPGQIFDATSSWRSLIPVVIHVATIFTLNNTYRIIGTYLTRWENHHKLLDFQNSLILKRFLFEAFDCYVALFYLAFYERNVERLRTELISVFNIDTFRRMALECLVPYVLQKLAKRGKKEKMTLGAEADLDEYEQFDDYMEIVITYGYVTLFASAYPLASVIAIAANLVEIRSDCFKLTYVTRRPRSLRSDGLGMWKTLLKCITWLSALTNCLIFGYTSGQLMHYLPNFYVVDETGMMRLRPNKGWLIIFIIFGMERALLYLGLLLKAVIPDTPEDVRNELERKHWYYENESRKGRTSSGTPEKNKKNQ